MPLHLQAETKQIQTPEAPHFYENLSPLYLSLQFAPPGPAFPDKPGVSNHNANNPTVHTIAWKGPG